VVIVLVWFSRLVLAAAVLLGVVMALSQSWNAAAQCFVFAVLALVVGQNFSARLRSARKTKAPLAEAGPGSPPPSDAN